jgi:flagellar hook-basal body complex protein FliE
MKHWEEMMIVSASDVILNTTNPKHIGQNFDVKIDNNPVPNFANALSKAFDKVNNLELTAQNMQLKMATEPESVNAHDVSIAQTQAELALSFAKSISTRLITGFNELTNIR